VYISGWVSSRNGNLSGVRNSLRLYTFKAIRPPDRNAKADYVKVSRTEAEVEVAVNLRPTVSRPVCLGVRHSSGTRDHNFLSP
jgi:hypothetical protein